MSEKKTTAKQQGQGPGNSFAAKGKQGTKGKLSQKP